MQALYFVLMMLMSFSVMSKEVSFTTADNATIHALYYQAGSQAVVLGHGAVFNKESWEELSKQLVSNNISVLAVDFRGYGQSTMGENGNALYEDILAGVHFLQQEGIENIALLGGSMGGKAVAEAAIHAKKGEINKLILLSPMPVATPEKLQGEILYIASEQEGGVEMFKTQFQKAPEPKTLKLIKGSTHAQHIFKTEQSATLTDIIVNFLTDSSK